MLCPCAVALLLAACGGGGGGGPGETLLPEIVVPETTTTGSTVRLELAIRSAVRGNLDDVQVAYGYPEGMEILQGSVGSLCPAVRSGNATPTHYHVTIDPLVEDTRCGVFMDIRFATTGDKTFEVAVGDATADGGRLANGVPSFATISVQ